ncbi:MAG: hypothetical protein HUU49_01260 [Candidatus Buchananbacteria bacterium]|nr:hypothetical protein [Candidatus Buchananbacteria bacterium]
MKIIVRKIILVLSVLTLIGYVSFGVVSKKINFIYQPFRADHLSLAFTATDSRAEQVPYLLADIKELKNGNNSTGVILYNDINKQKNLSVIASMADDIYISLFNQSQLTDDLSSKFNNNINIAFPFDLRFHLAHDSNVTLKYDKVNQSLNLVYKGQTLQINDDLKSFDDFVIYRLPGISPDSLIKVGELVVNLATYPNDLSVPLDQLTSQSFEIYRSADQNLLVSQNYSFEQGRWTPQVGDCSAYLPGDAAIKMDLIGNPSGGQALKISSTNHYACTFKPFSVSLNTNLLYVFSFDYQNLTGDEIRYYLYLKNQIDQTQEKFDSFNAQDRNWHKYQTVIKPTIDQADEMTVYVYAPSEGDREITNVYDNFQLGSYVLDRTVTLEGLKTDTNYGTNNVVTLKVGENNFRFPRTTTNLLKDFNPSFEQGLWDQEAGDCSNYLDGKPQFLMMSDIRATDGEKSLRLSSANHFACTIRSFPIVLTSDMLYKLSFDYKSIEGDKVQYYYTIKNDFGQVQEKFDSFEGLDPAWQRFEEIIDPKIVDANNFDFYFYAPSDGSVKITNLYDNLRLEEFAPKEIFSYFLYFNQPEKNSNNNSSTIIISSDSIWRHAVDLKNINSSFLLVYPEQYDDSWKLHTAQNTFTIADNLHFEIDGHGNGWWISVFDLCIDKKICEQNADGSYNMSLVIENTKFKKLQLVFFALLFIEFIILLFSYGKRK